jgi:hypothetical protein
VVDTIGAAAVVGVAAFFKVGCVTTVFVTRGTELAGTVTWPAGAAGAVVAGAFTTISSAGATVVVPGRTVVVVAGTVVVVVLVVVVVVEVVVVVGARNHFEFR